MATVDGSMRLDRYLASVTDYSRGDAKKLIKAGEVTLDGRPLTDPSAPVAPDAQLLLAGRALRPARHRYFMLHKPQGYVCANRDRRHPTVMELLNEDNLDRLAIAGRLDIDTTGLVLLTDDGDWAHRVMSPKSRCFKRYRVGTEQPIAASAVERCARGLYLGEEKRRTLPARLTILAPREARLEICEGKFHQVKRMFAALDNRVLSLHREAIAGLELDPGLGEGEYRALDETELGLALAEVDG